MIFFICSFRVAYLREAIIFQAPSFIVPRQDFSIMFVWVIMCKSNQF